MAMQTAISVGFYGKLPCKGDFLQRRVAQEFVEPWDAWLQQCMHASRQQLQERWLEAYLTSPIWRFVLGEGTCGTGAYAGVMLPSVDRVGRYFPLTIVAQLSADEGLLDIACNSARQWFDAVESLALSALQAHDLDLEAFDDEIAALGGSISHEGTAESGYLRGLMQQHDFAGAPAQWHVPLAAASSLQRAVNVFASRELERTLRPLVLWWTEGSDAVAPTWLCNRGLPAPGSFVAMLAAGWASAGWKTLDADAARDARLLRSPSQILEPARSSSHSHWPAHPAPAIPEPTGAAASGLPIQVSAWHEPVSREWGSHAPRAHFVLRPELGLWAISYSEEHEGLDPGAQMFADVLQSVPQSGTLTTLVEEVRRAVGRVEHQLAVQASTTRARSAARTIILLARGEECAVVCAGHVQVLRYRSAEVLPIISAAERAHQVPPLVMTGSTSLMDLLAAPATPEASILVCYETLRPGDVWVLGCAPLIDEQRLPELAAALRANGSGVAANRAELAGGRLGTSVGDSGAMRSLAAIRSVCLTGSGGPTRPLPVLLVAAESAAEAG